MAIEFRSFSKNAGFTGVRLAYTVVPKELMGEDSEGNKHSLHALWNRRQSTKFNGGSYIVQKGAFEPGEGYLRTSLKARKVSSNNIYYMTISSGNTQETIKLMFD